MHWKAERCDPGTSQIRRWNTTNWTARSVISFYNCRLICIVLVVGSWTAGKGSRMLLLRVTFFIFLPLPVWARLQDNFLAMCQHLKLNCAVGKCLWCMCVCVCVCVCLVPCSGRCCLLPPPTRSSIYTLLQQNHTNNSSEVPWKQKGLKLSWGEQAVGLFSHCIHITTKSLPLLTM